MRTIVPVALCICGLSLTATAQDRKRLPDVSTTIKGDLALPIPVNNPLFSSVTETVGMLGATIQFPIYKGLGAGVGANMSWFAIEERALAPFITSGEIRLNGCRVAGDALIGEAGKGFDYAQLRLEGARLFHCMRGTGMAARALEIAQDYVTHRESFGAPLVDHQLVQAMVADAHIDLYASRLMTREIARRLDAGDSIRHESSMAKVFVGDVAGEVVDTMLQFHGGWGYIEDFRVARAWRDQRLFRIGGGTSETMRYYIAKLMGL